MRSSSQREQASTFALALVAVSLVGFAAAWIFNWPSTFVLDDSADAQVGIEDVVNGTVTSIPLGPMVVLVIAALAARSRRWWGTAGLVVLLLLGILFTIGGIAEIRSENDEVSRSVLVVAGLLFAALGVALAALAMRALVGSGRSA